MKVGTLQITTICHFSLQYRGNNAQELILVASLVGYETQEKKIDSLGSKKLIIKLKETINELNTVTITAGSFEASDEKKMVMLKPLDIVTTAGGGADITAVMQLLPGTQKVGEQEGLFVRGGAAYETKTIIDGMIVQSPFYSSIPDIAQRGRFSPFMFKGTSFSTGGYSAQYGQALSSVLVLETQDKKSDESSLKIDANISNLTAAYTHKGSITGSISYTNLRPLFGMIKQTLDWEKVPQGLEVTFDVKEKIATNGVLKMYSTYSNSSSITNLPSSENPKDNYRFKLLNSNFFTNNSYQHSFKDGKWLLNTGLSYSNNFDKINLADVKSLDRTDERLQTRMVLTRFFKGNHTILMGAEAHRLVLNNKVAKGTYEITEKYSAAFVESEVYLTQKLAVRAGIRAEYSSAISKFNTAPRLSLAYKTGENSQISLAAGQFYQTPEKTYLYLNTDLTFELSNHLILNYQYIKNERTFRIEGYLKDYKNLVREQVTSFNPDPYRFATEKTDNTGYGYAKGIDVFFRDKKSIKNGDFWISYSLLDTKRLAGNFLDLAMPTFASKHNLSIVYKQYISAIKASVSATHRYTSGRPYYDFNNPTFMASRTKEFNNLSLSVSKIIFFNGKYAVFYASLDNVLGTKNSFGFRYSEDGKKAYEVRPASYRSLFFGVSLSL
ncbi:MAG: TonB-dependent receptor [Emticicia sp.]|nr:TonB-dependent receptor [Emticicia sp.]